MKQRTPNILKVAIAAAGGPSKVGELFGIGPQAVSKRAAACVWPADQIRALAAATGNVITTDQILEFLEAAAAERTTGTPRRRFSTEEAAHE